MTTELNSTDKFRGSTCLETQQLWGKRIFLGPEKSLNLQSTERRRRWRFSEGFPWILTSKALSSKDSESDVSQEWFGSRNDRSLAGEGSEIGTNCATTMTIKHQTALDIPGVPFLLVKKSLELS